MTTYFKTFTPNQELGASRWDEAARSWSREVLESRDGSDKPTTLWVAAVVLELFACWHLVASAQTKEDLAAMVPASSRHQAAAALTWLVRNKFLRSYSDAGARFYELNLS